MRFDRLIICTHASISGLLVFLGATAALAVESNLVLGSVKISPRSGLS